MSRAFIPPDLGLGDPGLGSVLPRNAPPTRQNDWGPRPSHPKNHILGVFIFKDAATPTIQNQAHTHAPHTIKGRVYPDEGTAAWSPHGREEVGDRRDGLVQDRPPPSREGVPSPRRGDMIQNPVAHQGREFRLPGNVQATPAGSRPLAWILLGSVQCLWGHFVHPHILGYRSR